MVLGFVPHDEAGDLDEPRGNPLHRNRGFGDLFSLPPLIMGSVLGPLLGARLRERLPEKAIRVGFAGFMVVALRTLARLEELG